MTYAPGSIKLHPDWPATPTHAVRTVFHDDDATICTSWQVVSPSSGVQYRTEAFVADWADAPGLTLTTEA